MKMTLTKSVRCFVLFLAAAGVDLRATPAEDYAALTKGIQKIPLKGSAGAVSVQGRASIPLILSPNKEILAAAAYFKDDPQRARIVVMAHTALLVPEGGSDWQKNIAVWTSRKNQPSVLLLGVNDKDWTAPDTKRIPAPKTWDANTLAGVDVIVASLHSAAFSEKATALLAFAERGGGLVLVSTPWAASKEALAAAGAIMEPAGLAFLGAGPSDSTFAIEPTLPLFANALTAVEAIAADQAGTAKLSAADRALCSTIIESCIASKVISEPLKNALNALHFSRGWVTVASDNILRRKARPVDAMLARYQHLILERLAPDKTPSHPSANDFPGTVGAGDAVVRTISFTANTGPNKFVNHGEKTRISTGVYARPGVPISVDIPEGAKTAGLKLEIGIHTDENWALADWRRVPEITRIVPLAAAHTLAANAFGGLVSILIPENCAAGALEATIKGAFEAPVFTLGKTTEAQWNAHIKNAPGAWGYIETPKWTGYFSSDFLRTEEHPEAIAKYWQAVVETADTILGYGAWRKRAESMLTDRDISVGYGHAGYPVLMAYAAEKEENHTALGRRAIQKGDWGFLHELGHTFQDSFDGNYTIATHAEVDVNLVPGLVLNLIHGRTAWDNNSHSTFDAKTRIADLEKWDALPESERTWAKACKMNVAYDFYFTLAECFGWEIYQKAFSRWMNWLQKPGSDPDMDAINSKDANAKRDRFLLLFSQASERNLLPYFQKYGLGKDDAGLSAKVIDKVSKLPVWTGNQPITELAGPAEVRIPKTAAAGIVLATFKATDTDKGSILTYKIKEAHSAGALAMEARTGRLLLSDPTLFKPGTITIEAQDNAIPLSTRELQCRLLSE
jgi:hypothetical protein